MANRLGIARAPRTFKRVIRGKTSAYVITASEPERRERETGMRRFKTLSAARGYLYKHCGKRALIEAEAERTGSRKKAEAFVAKLEAELTRRGTPRRNQRITWLKTKKGSTTTWTTPYFGLRAKVVHGGKYVDYHWEVRQGGKVVKSGGATAFQRAGTAAIAAAKRIQGTGAKANAPARTPSVNSKKFWGD